MSRDISVKKAIFIQKNCEFLQEFSFAHPITKLRTIMTYNSHFTGSPIWDLFGVEADHLEKAWNICIRKTFGLPPTTHKYFIEPISEVWHLKKVLIKRFLSFIKQIEDSPKLVPKFLLNVVKNDTRSFTGNNVRMIKLLCNKHQLSEIRPSDIGQIEYADMNKDDKWKIELVQEVLKLRFGQLDVEMFSDDELTDIMNVVCTS